MYRKIQRVQKVLNEAVLHTQRFQKASNISCPPGCHLCCLKKDISASPLEFLPLAYNLYKNNRAEEVYDKLSGDGNDGLCVIFQPLGIAGGGCSEYAHRGLICRLFGYASNPDKFQQKRLITCKTIKGTGAFSELSTKAIAKAPQFSDYYMRLAAIDFRLANEQLHINEAIKRAIELVLTHFMYRNRKRGA